MNLVDKEELIDGMKFTNKFSGTVIIEEKKKAFQEGKRYQAEIVIWVDDLELDQGNARTAIY